MYIPHVINSFIQNSWIYFLYIEAVFEKNLRNGKDNEECWWWVRIQEK